MTNNIKKTIDNELRPCAKETEMNTDLGYGFYSNILKRPFESLDALKKAEAVHFEEQKAKEEKASKKKADAKKVEEAFKILLQEFPKTC